MRHKKRFFAGLLSATVLMQGAAALPAPRGAKPLTAEAVSVRSIQTRVFEFDFGSFRALYDNRTAKWYTPEGAPIVSRTEDVQRVENPFFGDADYGESNIYAFTVDMTNMTIELECGDGTIINLDDLAAAFDNSLRSSIMISQILEITPEYAPQYYDKAQQRDADVPKPADFPLIYVWRIAAGESEPHTKKNTVAYCDIYFGEHLYGTCFAFDGEITFTKTTGIAEEGAGAPFTDTGDATLDGTLDVSDAVLTCRVIGECEDTVISELGTVLADMDGDGLLTAGDITDMLKAIAGLSVG